MLDDKHNRAFESYLRSNLESECSHFFQVYVRISCMDNLYLRLFLISKESFHVARRTVKSLICQFLLSCVLQIYLFSNMTRYITVV